MSKINVYSSSASNAIKVFDANSSGVKPGNAILVTTGTEPTNAIQINVGEKKWSSIAVNFADEDPGPGPEPSLPPFTIRVKLKQGISPDWTVPLGYSTSVLVDEINNIWDVKFVSQVWNGLFASTYSPPKTDYLLEVLGANTTSITSMSNMFARCHSLTSVQLFNTYSVRNMENMFLQCISLSSVPLFDTSRVTNMNGTFNECTNVQSGALALYQQASTQTNPPSSHSYTFRNCGRDTETGAAELSQIPDDWK